MGHHLQLNIDVEEEKWDMQGDIDPKREFQPPLSAS